MATAAIEKIKDFFPKSSEVPKDQQPFWQTLEWLKKLGQENKTDATAWFAAVSDTLRSALPGNTKLLAEFDALYQQAPRDREPSLQTPATGDPEPPKDSQSESKWSDDRRKKALDIIQLAQSTMMLNRPGASGLDQRIRDLITQEHLKSWWFRLPMFGLVVLAAALLGIDWSYANKAKQVLKDMEKPLQNAKALLETEASDLKKAVADMQKQVDDSRGMLSQKDSELKVVLAGAQNRITTAGDQGIGVLNTATAKAVADIQAKQVENARAQKLEIAQIPWTGWLLARGYLPALLSLLFSLAAFAVSLFNIRQWRKLRRPPTGRVAVP
jgi:uncharacterized phage infection (PIP) family protein YhgE